MGTKRGTELRTGNRFEKQHLEPFYDGWDEPLELPVIQTEFLPDHSRSALAKNDSPDIPFTYSLNLYRGCEHGCAYCYARPSHEYLGFNASIDFESKIMVKHDAARLLEQEFEKKSWKPQSIALSGNTDCYQPAERKFRLTRKALEVLLRYRNPVSIVTKNALVLRDLDLLTQLGELNLVRVLMTVTTLDEKLSRDLEPRTSTISRRMRAIQGLSQAGVPVGVMIGPTIPALTDHEIPGILTAAKEAGAQYASYNILRLPLVVEPIFREWLERCRPGEADRVLTRIRMIRSGKLNDSDFSNRMQGHGAYADYIHQTFSVHAKRLGLDHEVELSIEHFRRFGKSRDTLSAGLFGEQEG